MACDVVQLPGGGSAIVCGTRARSRCACGRRATLLCDWKMPSRRSGTCDAAICTRCATAPAPDKDLCAPHARAFDDWRGARRAASPPVEGVML